jgi:hypothetical protein
MDYQFLPDESRAYTRKVAVGPENGWIEYLYIDTGDEVILVEASAHCNCSPFNKVILTEGVLAMGYQDQFHLLEVTTLQCLLSLQTDFYFEDIKLHEGIFYITDACFVNAVTDYGKHIWKSECVGIDGVILQEITHSAINGIGEMDPPGGWVPFSLNPSTGKRQ